MAIFAGILAYIAGHTTIMRKIEKDGVGERSVYLTQYSLNAAAVEKAFPLERAGKAGFTFAP